MSFNTFGIITELMKSNFLKLNPNKTVFLPISRSNPHTNYLPLKLNESTLIPPSKSARFKFLETHLSPPKILLL